MLVLVVGGALGPALLSHHLMRIRDIETVLPPETLRELFRECVAGAGWRIMEEGNPMVARSIFFIGSRQRIALTTEPLGDRTAARIEVLAYDGKWSGLPRKPYTLWFRMRSFVRAVEAADPSAWVSP